MQGDINVRAANAPKERNKAVCGFEGSCGDLVRVAGLLSSRNQELFECALPVDGPYDPLPVPDSSSVLCWAFANNLRLTGVAHEGFEKGFCDHIGRFFSKI